SATPNRGRMRSRLRRCSTSSLQNGARPARISSMAGWYSLRQASAKANQSRRWPAAPRMVSASPATPVRKSTTVPKTSKNSALTVIISLQSAQLRSRRLHAIRFEHLGGGGARERIKQRLGGHALLPLCANPGRIDGVVLDLRGQRTDQRDALHVKDFADLMNAEIGLTPRNVLGDRAAGNELCLRLHLAGNPELVEQTGDVDPARATGGRIEIGDGLGGEQRLLERRDRADVRLRRAVFDNH